MVRSLTKAHNNKIHAKSMEKHIKIEQLPTEIWDQIRLARGMDGELCQAVGGQ